jgi:hypothetical protein
VQLSNLKGKPFSLQDRFNGNLYKRVQECEALILAPSPAGRPKEQQASPFTMNELEGAWKRALMSSVDSPGLSTESLQKLRQLAIDYNVSKRCYVILEEDTSFGSMLADDMESLQMERSISASYFAAKALLISPDGTAAATTDDDGKEKLRQFPSVKEMATNPCWKDVSALSLSIRSQLLYFVLNSTDLPPCRPYCPHHG